MSAVVRPVGLLLAAGRGRRMGETKQLLPWPGADGRASTVVAVSFELVASFASPVYVVLDHEAERVMAALPVDAFTVVRGDADADQSTSVRVGLDAIRAAGHRAPVLLHLADHPGVRCETIAALLAHASRDPTRAVVPVFEGRGGHPTIVPERLVEPLASNRLPAGLRAFWRDNPDAVSRVPVDDPGVRRDLDTPDDYRAASDA